MTDDRLAHLLDVAPALWPAPHAVGVHRRSGDRTPGSVDEYLLLPSGRRPRLLVPHERRAAAAVVRHQGADRGGAHRVASGLLACGLRAGLGRWWPDRLRVSRPAGAPSATLPAHLAHVLGSDLVVAMRLTPPRANRKPVLQLLGPDGRTLGYAKLAVDALTDALVEAETGALRTLATRFPGIVELPSVLHAGRWQDRALLVQSALPVESARRPLTGQLLVRAVGEIAALGRVDDVELDTSPFWADLRSRIAGLPRGEAADRLRGSVARLGAAAGGTRVSLGASHGDWTPWNAAALGDRVLVWDWERFRSAVPRGFDLLHHGFQRDVVAGTDDAAAAARRLVDGAATRLAPLGQSGRTAPVTVSLYLADLGVRYLADRQLEAGARLGDVTTYLLPALDRAIGHLEGNPR